MIDLIINIIAGVGIAVWVFGPVLAILWPQRRHDPQRGMAVGLLMIVSMVGVLAALLYAAGLIWNIRWLVYIPFAITSYVLFMVLCGAVRAVAVRVLGRRAGHEAGRP